MVADEHSQRRGEVTGGRHSAPYKSTGQTPDGVQQRRTDRNARAVSVPPAATFCSSNFPSDLTPAELKRTDQQGRRKEQSGRTAPSDGTEPERLSAGALR